MRAVDELLRCRQLGVRLGLLDVVHHDIGFVDRRHNHMDQGGRSFRERLRFECCQLPRDHVAVAGDQVEPGHGADFFLHLLSAFRHPEIQVPTAGRRVRYSALRWLGNLHHGPKLRPRFLAVHAVLVDIDHDQAGHTSVKRPVVALRHLFGYRPIGGSQLLPALNPWRFVLVDRKRRHTRAKQSV